MPEHINKQQLLKKAKSHQGNPFGVPLIIAEIEKADAVDLVSGEYIRLAEAKEAIMNYIRNQTVSKYPTPELCRASRKGAEGAMHELDYIPVSVFGERKDE